MSRLYIVIRTYTPDSAAGIRFRSFLRGFIFSKYPITIVLISPDSKRSTLDIESDNISVLNLWKDSFSNNRLVEKIKVFNRVLSLFRIIKEGDSVLVMGYSEILPLLYRKKDINVYYEITECPEISLTQFRYFGTKASDFIRYCKKLTGLFVISESLRKYFIEHGVNGRNIHVINMTVDSDRFNVKEIIKTERYIAYCGTVSNYKDGVDNLIRSFAIVSKKIKDIKLYIIGSIPGKRQTDDNIRLAEELGVSERIIFTGKVPPDSIPRLLLNAEVLALERPNNVQAKYGFPTKLGEYLMTGNPVVLTDVGDISNFLVDKLSAIIVEPDNVEKFSDALIWVLENPDVAKVIGQRGKEVALSCFDGFTESLKMVNIISYGSIQV